MQRMEIPGCHLCPFREDWGHARGVKWTCYWTGEATPSGSAVRSDCPLVDGGVELKLKPGVEVKS